MCINQLCIIHYRVQFCVSKTVFCCGSPLVSRGKGGGWTFTDPIPKKLVVRTKRGESCEWYPTMKVWCSTVRHNLMELISVVLSYVCCDLYGLWTVNHLLVFGWWKSSRVGGRAFSVHEVSRGGYLFCFAHQSAILSLRVTRSYISAWKIYQPKTDKWPVQGVL